MESLNCLHIGTTLQNGNRKYRIKRVLGQDLFSISYLATTHETIYDWYRGPVELDVECVIKEFFIHQINWRRADKVKVTSLLGSIFSNYRCEFRQKAKALLSEWHSSVSNVFDCFDKNGTTYYVRDYIEGLNLDEYIDRNGPLSEVEAILAIRTIGSALCYLHSNNLLHLGVRPANIIRCPTGVYYLTDFDLSIMYTEDDIRECVTAIGGDARYASVEQMRCKSDVGGRASVDVYALSASLLTALTGGVPGEAGNMFYADDYPANELRKVGVSESTIEVVNKGMAPCRNMRYQSVDAFLRDLKDIWVDDTELSNDGEINCHGFVDLGLPSGLKWATCNVGASSPSEYGDYFAWGETRAISGHNQASRLTYGKTISELLLEGIISPVGLLKPLYDAAQANWGVTWRIPTKAEWEELYDNCEWMWYRYNDRYGYRVIGPNGKMIFLPFAGWYSGSGLSGATHYGSYWSATVYPGYSASYYFVLHQGPFCGMGMTMDYRYDGRSVRPVSK